MAKDVEELRRLLVRVLDAVERGELTADTPRAIALLRRLEGARTALDELSRKAPSHERASASRLPRRSLQPRRIRRT